MSFLLDLMVFGIESCMMVVPHKSEKRSKFLIMQDGIFCWSKMPIGSI